MAQDEKFEFESIQDTQTIKDYLQSLIDGIDKGKVLLSSDGNDLELNPGSLLKFEVKAKKKGDSTKLTLKLSWRQPDAEEAENDDMSISS
jgi:amphi-Trp domain-containing protein